MKMASDQPIRQKIARICRFGYSYSPLSYLAETEFLLVCSLMATVSLEPYTEYSISDAITHLLCFLITCFKNQSQSYVYKYWLFVLAINCARLTCISGNHMQNEAWPCMCNLFACFGWEMILLYFRLLVSCKHWPQCILRSVFQKYILQS